MGLDMGLDLIGARGMKAARHTLMLGECSRFMHWSQAHPTAPAPQRNVMGAGRVFSSITKRSAQRIRRLSGAPPFTSPRETYTVRTITFFFVREGTHHPQETSATPLDLLKLDSNVRGIREGCKVSIITQNENGPCPLIAICNILLLRGDISLHSDLRSVRFGELVNLISSVLMERME